MKVVVYYSGSASMCWQPSCVRKHMASETLPHSIVQLTGWSVSVAWLHRSERWGKRGLPVCQWQACNRTHSVIWWPALCLLDLSVLTVWPLPTHIPSLPLICRPHLISPGFSETLQCIVSTTSLTSPFHCWGGKAEQSHPPSLCLSVL